MLGLAVLFVTIPALHGVIMLLGGSYLAYLGFLMARSKNTLNLNRTLILNLISKPRLKRNFERALVNLSNAKVVVYFSSVMSLVLVNITEMWQIILAFMVIVVETFCYFYVISLIFSRNIAKRLYSQYSRYIDNMAGIVFLFLVVCLFITASTK